MKSSLYLLATLLMPVALPAYPEGPTSEEVTFFETEIRPVLSERCFRCHGPEKQQLGLRLDSRDSLLKGSDAGPVISPNDAASSRLLAVLRQEGEVKMPPDGKLTDVQLSSFERWVTLGAPWPVDPAAQPEQGMEQRIGEALRSHWSFQPVTSPVPPVVNEAAWLKSPVDPFVLAKLEAAGLSHAAPADKRTLLRRVTFNLTGLPPTPEEVRSFLADSSADAFAKVVDRLLASPHYGERWARHWLDVVRYTDTVDSRAGYPTDVVEAWKYRDWIVNALNEDRPYDEFVRWQIAGDLYPPHGQPEGTFNPEGLIATGMLAIGNFPAGDADKEKMVTDLVDDQVDVVSRGFLSMTLSCARCHDHKFDPYTARDYYAMAGIFFSTTILPGPGAKTEGSPILHIPLETKEQLALREQHTQQLAALEGQLKGLEDGHKRAHTLAMLPRLKEHALAAWDYHTAETGETLAAFAAARSIDAESLQRLLGYLGLEKYKLLTNLLRDVHGKAGLHAFMSEAGDASLTVNTNDVPLQFLTILQPMRSVSLHPSPAAPVAIAWRSPVSGVVELQATVRDIDASCGDGIGWAVERWHGSGTELLAEGGIDNGGTQVLNGAPASEGLQTVEVQQGDLLLLKVLPKTSHACDSTQVLWQIKELTGEQSVWKLSEELLANFLEAGNPRMDSRGNTGVWSYLDLNAAGAVPASGSALAVWEAARARAGTAPLDRTLVERAASALQVALEAEAALLDVASTLDPATPPGPLLQQLLREGGPFWQLPAQLPPEAQAERDRLVQALSDLRALPVVPVEYAVGVLEGGVPNTGHAGIHDVHIHLRGDYNRLGELVPRGFPTILTKEPANIGTETSGRRHLAEWIANPENPLTARVMVNRVWQFHFGEGLVRTPGDFGYQGEKPTHPELLDFLAAEFMKGGWSVKALHRLILLSATYQQSVHAEAPTLQADPENRLLARMNRRRLEAESLRDALLAVTGKLDRTMGGLAVREIEMPRRTLYLRTNRSDRTSFAMLFDAADPTTVIVQRTESTVAPQALFLLNHPFALGQTKELATTVASDAADEQNKIIALYDLLYAREPKVEEVQLGREILAGSRPTAGEAGAWEQYCQVLLCANEFMYLD